MAAGRTALWQHSQPQQAVAPLRTSSQALQLKPHDSALAGRKACWTACSGRCWGRALPMCLPVNIQSLTVQSWLAVRIALNRSTYWTLTTFFRCPLQELRQGGGTKEVTQPFRTWRRDAIGSAVEVNRVLLLSPSHAAHLPEQGGLQEGQQSAFQEVAGLICQSREFHRPCTTMAARVLD